MSEADQGTELDLRRFLRVIWERAWLVVLASLLVAVPTVLATKAQTPRYRSSAELLLEPSRSQALFQPAGSPGLAPTLATELRRLQGRAVADLAARKLGYRAKVSVTGSGTDNVITVTAVATEAAAAARVAGAYVDAYIEHRRASEAADVESAKAEIQRKIDQKQRVVQAIDTEVAAAPDPARAALAEQRRSERARLVNQQDLLLEQMDRLDVGASFDGVGVELLTPPVPPGSPFEPAVARTALLAVVVGLMFGVGLAFVVDFFDDSIKREEDVARAVPGLPVLGTIPAVAAGRHAKLAQVVSVVAPDSPAAEAYRGLRTTVQFLGLDWPVRVLQVTSPAVSEGKTTTVANLAVALARAGHKVTAVCCDLRRPRLHEFFGLSNEKGLTSVLLGEVELDVARQSVAGVENLTLLSSGPRPPNPSELLAGRQFAEMLAAVQADTDIVVLDSPPVLPVSDAAVLADKVDAILLVARSRSTRRKELRRAVGTLKQVDGPVVGTVLIGFSGGHSYAYSYHETGSLPRRRTGPGPARPSQSNDR